jgi:2-polyprenyl-6-methoxyphenol hydroxylase-like FAD-dependent oxidoreductase
MRTPDSLSSPPAGKHAIVYGGSMAGLVTTGMLARHFERVTLVERDRFEQGAVQRKGSPQAHHVHGLLTRGMNVLGELFPGFKEDLKAAGAQFFDMSGEHAWFMGGLWRPRVTSGISFHAQSRPLLEWTVRQRVLALPNVRVLDGREVTGFQLSADKARVTGVHLQAPGGADAETLEGELVVDTSGRGSRTPQWLEALGYPRVEETRIPINLVYSSRVFQPPPGFAASWKMLSIGPQLPKERRIGFISVIEGGRWLVSLGGWLGEQPPMDDTGYVEYTRGLPQPHLHEALRHATPLGPINVFNFSHNQRRHYERMTRFPEGLVVVGDAFCSFNPIYGQGMTMGALQAEALGECLRQGLDGVARRYRQRVSKLFTVPWALATSGDLRFPEVEGVRPMGLELMNRYGDRFQQLAGYDPEALKTLVRVIHMLESPAAMFSPRMVMKILTTRPDAASLSRQPEPLLAPRSQAA